MRLSALALALALLMAPLCAAADSTLDDFSNEKVLAAAAAEIQSMNLAQLEAAIEYIVACAQPPSAERTYHCGRNDSIASIKTAAAINFAKIRAAAYTAEKDALAAANGPFGSAPVTLTEVRRIAIFEKLNDAASDRYKKLIK